MKKRLIGTGLAISLALSNIGALPTGQAKKEAAALP